jgi:hypothetical protein
MVPGANHPKRQGQEELAGKMPGYQPNQPVPVLPVQLQGARLLLGGLPQFRIVHVQPGQGGNNPLAVIACQILFIKDGNAGGAGIQLHLADAGNPFQAP